MVYRCVARSPGTNWIRGMNPLVMFGRSSTFVAEQEEQQPITTRTTLTSPHLTSPHLTSPHLTSPHLTSPHHCHFGSGHGQLRCRKLAPQSIDAFFAEGPRISAMLGQGLAVTKEVLFCFGFGRFLSQMRGIYHVVFVGNLDT